MKKKSLISITLASLLVSGAIVGGCTQTENTESSQPQNSVSSVTSETSEISETSQEKESSAESSAESSEESSEPEQPKISPTMWKVTDQDGNFIYMMGSIHVADSEVMNMPEYFEAAYAQSNAIAVECDTTEIVNDLSQSFAMISKMKYPDNSTLDQHVSKEIYDAAVKALKDDKIYSPLYDYYKPIFWTSMMDAMAVEKSKLSTDYGVDMTIINRAKADEKEVLEIESVDFQNDLLANFSEDIQNLMLKAYVMNGYSSEEAAKELEELYEHWKNGTITEELLNQEDDFSDITEFTEEEKAAYEEYNKQMLTDRNIGMADKAQEYLQGDKTVLYIVGAAHYYGDNGLMKLLTDKGCTFEVLTNENIQYEQESSEESEPAASAQEAESSIEEISVQLDPNSVRAA